MKNIDEEIEFTLSSLDGLKSADLPPGFKEEVLQKISFLAKPDPWIKYIRISVAAMILLSLSNVFVLLSMDSETEAQDYIGTNELEYYFDYDETY